MADMDIRSDMETSTNGYGKNARDHRSSTMRLMRDCRDKIGKRDQDGQRCNGHKLGQSRRHRHLDDGAWLRMAPEIITDPNDIWNIRTEIGDGASDRTTSGTMQSNMQHREVCHGNLV